MAMALAVLAGLTVVIAGAAWLFAPALVQQVLADLSRFRPDPTRMAVLEARPLFLYTGNWTWSQPWVFFRSGFYVGAIAVVGLAVSLWRSRRADHLLIVCFTLANYAATVGQNRFGYYLVPATAVVCGWLATKLLDWGGVPHAGNPEPKTRRPMPFQREIAVIAVAGAIVAPNIVPAAVTTTRVGGMADYWFEAMQWLRKTTPEPFGSADHYLARYDGSGAPASYTVMNWWDQGYWIVQSARRVPVSNPTQGGAPIAALFLTATDESEALALLTPQRARYVIVDLELPFREGNRRRARRTFPESRRLGRHPNLALLLAVLLTRERCRLPGSRPGSFASRTTRRMVYRLMVLGGAAAVPDNNTYVVELRDRTDVTGRQFCEVVSRQQFATADEARTRGGAKWRGTQRGWAHAVASRLPSCRRHRPARSGRLP